MRGWRRIGIVLSVIWFLGLGVFLWVETVQKLDADNCFHLYEKDTVKCIANATLLRWSSNHPINNLTTGLAILGIDLATIGLGWLIVWGCVSVVRWIRRGFAHDAAR
jgi:hypothetical protein